MFVISLTQNMIHTKQADDLSTFIKHHKVQKGFDYTHTIFGGKNNCCTMYVPADDLQTFLALYKEEFIKKGTLNITEKHRHISPIFIDLDFRQATQQRVYTSNDISSFCSVTL